MYFDNYIEELKRGMEFSYTDEYINFYEHFNHSELAIIFSTLHSELIESFSTLNQRLPTGEDGDNFWAEPSRNLIRIIDIVKTLQRKAEKTEYAFKIEENYQLIINTCESFLSPRWGSQIPPNMDKIELYYKQAIFLKSNSVIIEHRPEIKNLDLKLIGEGSYAHVYKFYDPFYNKSFVLKRAKNDLTQKEIERFKQEFDTMKNISSPYVLEVYAYNQDKTEYIMEYMDYTLHDYIKENNDKLQLSERKSMVAQILKAFNYISEKNILHRDISPKNILLKKYEHTIVLKISDFGLVKVPSRDLTSENSELKGYFNDPDLRLTGFASYNISHETYALTRLIFFIMTGKTNTTNIKDEKMRIFINNGLNSSVENRYKSILDLDKAFKQI